MSVPNGSNVDRQWRFAGSAKAVDGGCERPKLLVDLLSDETMVVSCGSSSRSVCGPCAVKYRRRVGRIFMSGHTDTPTERLYGLTLTAPGAEQHCRRHRKCTGDILAECDMCPCTVAGGVSLPAWNAVSGRRFNHFMTRLRQEYGDVQYSRGAEVQDRGALHFHLMIRCTALLAVADVRRIAIECGFGHSVDLDCLKPIAGTGDVEACGRKGKRQERYANVPAETRVFWAAFYCSKYVSKSADDRGTLPWLTGQGEIVTGNGRYRTWTASRSWGLSMKALKLSQRAFAKNAEAGDPSGVAAALAPKAPLDSYSESYKNRTEEIARALTE